MEKQTPKKKVKQKDYMVSCKLTNRNASTPEEAKIIVAELQAIPLSGTITVYKVMKRYKREVQK